MTKIRSEVQEEDKEQTKGTMEIMHVDLASLQSTKHFAEAFKARRLPLHVLINNAGIALARKGFTEDSYESHFQVHTYIYICLAKNLQLIECVYIIITILELHASCNCILLLFYI